MAIVIPDELEKEFRATCVRLERLYRYDPNGSDFICAFCGREEDDGNICHHADNCLGIKLALLESVDVLHLTDDGQPWPLCPEPHA